MIRKDEKTAVIEANRTHATDTGSPEVQIAILTARIQELTEHLKVHIPRQPQPPRPAQDGSVSADKMLDYLMAKDIERYRAIIAKLGIPKVRRSAEACGAGRQRNTQMKNRLRNANGIFRGVLSSCPSCSRRSVTTTNQEGWRGLRATPSSHPSELAF